MLTSSLNSNIRCIEIIIMKIQLCLKLRLNSNIRCIEICKNAAYKCQFCMLNSNIRCIEIYNYVSDVSVEEG